MIYVKGMRTRTTVILAWSSLTFIVVLWTWRLVAGGFMPSEQP